MKKTLFYYTNLPDERFRGLYRNILTSIKSGKNSAKAENVRFTMDDATKVLYAIKYDYPELFYVDFFGDNGSVKFINNTDVEIRFKYLFPPEIQAKKIEENRAFIQYITSHVPDSVRPSQYLTALWLHDLLAINMRYDHEGREKKLRQIYTIEGGISSKKAVCGGISFLYMMLCEQMDLWCAYIVGHTHLDEEDKKTNIEGSTGRHAWNLLRLDGSYAYTDVTWDLQDDDSNEHISHAYFGMCDEQCSRTRQLEYYFDRIKYPVCSGPGSLNYFVREHCFFCNLKEVLSHIHMITTTHKTHTEFMLDPGGESFDTLLDYVPKWISKYLNSTHRVKRWSWIRDRRMLVFKYTFEYYN